MVGLLIAAFRDKVHLTNPVTVSMLRFLLSFWLFAAPAWAADLTVFVAASMGDVLGEAADVWEDQTGQHVTIAPAGSSVLARQIAAGAPADVFVSASPDWMDWLDEQGMIAPDTRRDLAANALVLIGHGSGETRDMPADISALLPDDTRLAMALVDAVPAGIYGKAALMHLGQWDAIAPRVAQTDNVRSALALVALGEAPLGIVYATDAASDDRVHVVARFPDESHPPITYPAAITADAPNSDAAQAFLEWLASAEGQALFARYGFVPVTE